MIETGSQRLRRLCVEYKVPNEVEEVLLRQAEFIAEWRSSIRPESKTPSQRAGSLKRIADLAEKLKEQIESLPFSDRLALDNAYFEPDRPVILDAVEGGADPRQFDLGGFVLPELQRAAISVERQIRGVGKTGAQSLTERQADFIRCIAQSVKPAGLVPAHTGQFLDLCMAIFDAGGVTFPERAMRHFMKEIRPSLRSAGYCL